jgi:hypothetical protein
MASRVLPAGEVVSRPPRRTKDLAISGTAASVAAEIRAVAAKIAAVGYVQRASVVVTEGGRTRRIEGLPGQVLAALDRLPEETEAEASARYVVGKSEEPARGPDEEGYLEVQVAPRVRAIPPGVPVVVNIGAWIVSPDEVTPCEFVTVVAALWTGTGGELPAGVGELEEPEEGWAVYEVLPPAAPGEWTLEVEVETEYGRASGRAARPVTVAGQVERERAEEVAAAEELAAAERARVRAELLDELRVERERERALERERDRERDRERAEELAQLRAELAAERERQRERERVLEGLLEELRAQRQRERAEELAAAERPAGVAGAVRGAVAAIGRFFGFGRRR